MDERTLRTPVRCVSLESLLTTVHKVLPVQELCTLSQEVSWDVGDFFDLIGHVGRRSKVGRG